MTRVSLREAYDNKDVVAQIYAIRDTAESAVDTSEQAVTTANTASDHVDALVPQVEGAVQNANQASASAQASAQTVAGYENRLATVEDATEDLAGDLNAVTLRVTTAEGDIVTIQGRVTALETADGNNVKITGTHAIGDYAVLLVNNQNVDGEKRFLNKLYGNIPVLAPSSTNVNAYVKVADLGVSGTGDLFVSFAFAERYSCGFVHFNYVTNTGVTGASKIATADNENITVGIFEETNGHVWLVTKRLSSGANRCSITGMLTMRGTSEVIPLFNVDGTVFTDNDGTYFEGAKI